MCTRVPVQVKPVSMQNPRCTLCKTGAFETVLHFMFECEELHQSRQQLIEIVTSCCPVGANIIHTKDTKSIVSAQLYVGSRYKQKLASVAKTVLDMYQVRQRKLRT